MIFYSNFRNQPNIFYAFSAYIKSKPVDWAYIKVIFAWGREKNICLYINILINSAITITAMVCSIFDGIPPKHKYYFSYYCAVVDSNKEIIFLLFLKHIKL